MVEPVDTYFIVRFSGLSEQASFIGRLLEYVGSEEGLVYFEEPHRAVAWSPGPLGLGRPDTLCVYLSEGAVRAAGDAGLACDAAERIAAEDLPGGLTLLLGDARDGIR